MLKARKKEPARNKKVKVISSTLFGGISSIGLQVPRNLKDCINLRNGADKEVLKELDDAALDMMNTYMELHKQSGTTQDYVTRGAKISCSCGEYHILLDAVEDHGVIAANGKPLLTCRDCRENINIHSFGKCFAEVKDCGKLPQPLNNRIMPLGDKWIYRCIPNPTGRWMQKESVLQIGDEEGEEYNAVLVSGAYLPCRHGGIIEVVEVPETDPMADEKWINAIDDIETIGNYKEEQIYTVKYVGKVLLKEGYKVNFVCGVLGNILKEGAKAGFFESSNYEKNPGDKPSYLIHMDKVHHYRPSSKETKYEHISGYHIYDLNSGTGIFTKQLCWDSVNNRFQCKDFKAHRFGFGICQWTDPGNEPKHISEPVPEEDLGRLPKLVKWYLDEFGEYAFPSREECLRLETRYLLEEFNKYSSIPGINKEDCELESAAREFMIQFEKPRDYDDIEKQQDRIEAARLVLAEFEEVGINGEK